MYTLSTLRVVVITGRGDLVSFCRDILEYQASVRVENKLIESLFQESSFYVIDADLLQSAPVQSLEKIKLYSNKILFLIPSDGTVQALDFFNSLCKYSISFPLDENLFTSHFYKMISNYKTGVSNSDSIQDDSVPDSIMGFFGGKSRAMYEVRRKILKAARVNTPVLLLGETGTGKTTAAELIHKLSDRAKNIFKDKNVSTISDSLACSTLFGTESGAFTDAVKNDGLFIIANGGTLFLDEIGMATLSLQAMLLTVIETHLIQKVGSEKSEKVDVRLIFATNASIKKMIQDGSFRPDLYFRISDIVIHIPPLRERKEDIRVIAKDYTEKKNKLLSEEALKKLEAYDWPGNIRELLKCLDNAIDDARDKTITADNIDFGLFD